MIKSLVFSVLMFVATPLTTFAAPVYFVGTLTSSTAGVTLGTPPISFATWFDVGPANIIGFSSVSQGVFKTPILAPTFTSSVTGTVITSASNMTYSLVIPGGPGVFPNSRTLVFSFSNPNILTTNSVAQNFQAILMQSTGVELSEIESGGGGAQTYSGTITATPEPGSLLAFSVLAASIGGVKLRRLSRKANAAHA